MLVGLTPIGIEHYQRVDIPDSGHEFDAQQMGDTEYDGTLCMRIAMNTSRLNIRLIFHQASDHVNRFSHTTGDKAAE